MPFSLPLFGMKGYGSLTQTAATPIIRTVEPMLNAATIIADLVYTAAGTAHTITVLRPLGSTTVATATAAAGTGLTPAADPGAWGSTRAVAANAIAANDYIVAELADGTFHTSKIASGTFAGANLVLTTALPTNIGLAVGAKIWFFGITTDKNPSDNLAHPAFTGTASVTTSFGGNASDGIAGIVGSFGKYEPLLVYSDNATAAGTLERVTAVYTNKLGPSVTNA